MPNHFPQQYPTKEKVLRRVIWYVFLEIGVDRNETLSEIKPPLALINSHLVHLVEDLTEISSEFNPPLT